MLDGRYADVYLNFRRLSRGYTASVWKAGHVSELTHVSDDEVAGYCNETTWAARAIEAVYSPAKLNFRQPALPVRYESRGRCIQGLIPDG